jgi:hypothetical protein
MAYYAQKKAKFEAQRTEATQRRALAASSSTSQGYFSIGANLGTDVLCAGKLVLGGARTL